MMPLRRALVVGRLLVLAALTALALVVVLSRAYAQPAPLSPHCFWKVSSPPTVLYLVGSMHVLQQEMEQEMAPLVALSLPYLHQAHTVVFEQRMDGTSADEHRTRLWSKMVNSDRTIPEILSAETLAVLHQTMAAMHMELAPWQRLQPWALGSVLRQAYRTKIGWKGQYGLDQLFLKKAQEAQKTIVGLETAQEQWELFDEMASRLSAMTDEQQDQHLRAILQSLPEMEQMYTQMVRAAVVCDLPVLEHVLAHMEHEAPDGYDLLFRRRNRRWLATLDTFLQQEGVYFVVVGLGHLIGPENVRQLLTERGYRVEQL
jgi:uncharacterized protein